MDNLSWTQLSFRIGGNEDQKNFVFRKTSRLALYDSGNGLILSGMLCRTFNSLEVLREDDKIDKIVIFVF